MTQFEFCPQCGRRGTVRLFAGKNLRCECGFSLFFDAASAAALIVEFDGKILLEKRSKNPKAGFWALPGGFVEAGESLEEAAARECREELGFSPSKMEYLCSFANKYRFEGVEYSTCDAFFYAKAEIPAEKIKIQRSEVAETAFFGKNQVPLDKIAFDSVKKAIEIWQKSV